MNEEMLFKGVYTLSLKEYRAFTLYHQRNQLRFYPVFIFLVFSVTVLFSGGHISDWAYFVPIGVGVAVAVSLLSYLSVIFRTHRVYKSNKIIQKDQTIELSERGLHLTSVNSTSWIEWTDVYKAVESKSQYLIYISKNQAVVVPKEKVDHIKLSAVLQTFMDAKKLRIS
ncbi:YcxB family protein [Paenibacillus albus]|uniref:YcxB family protein n=1 Tax=Paenibacillus albus TaxID=2495582 RepID=A0A3Q8X4Y8_9BACL|nr:YcxB family protein [Paenibacillus albus]AZN39360.1 YcxB family protein [Paenibacillus albus]